MAKNRAEPKAAKQKKPNRYKAIIQTIFERHYHSDQTEFEFSRKEMENVARELGIVCCDHERRTVRRQRAQRFSELAAPGAMTVSGLR